MAHKQTSGLAVAALAVALALTGCTGDDSTDETQDDVVAEETDDGAGDPAAEGGDDVQDAEEESHAGVEVPATEPIRSFTHDVADDATLTVDVAEVEVVGDLLRVALTFTPQWEGDEETEALATLMGSSGPGNGIALVAVDPVNLLEYSQVTNPVPHGQSVQVRSGIPTTIRWYFAAPVDPMESFDLQWRAGSGVYTYPSLTDIPLEG